MGKVLVVGGSNTDFIFKIPAMPKPGETIIGGEFLKARGGKGANQAIAAVRAEALVTFICRVGYDELGKASVDHYSKEGIITSHIIFDNTKPSGVAGIFVDTNGENSIAVASGANYNLSPDDIEKNKNIIEDSDIILLQLEIPIETVESVIRIAHQLQKQIILNPAPAQQLDDDLLEMVTIITPNEHEAEYITGVEVKDELTAAKAGKELLSKGIKTVLITLGSRGIFFMDNSNQKLFPSFKVKAVDTTGAGDTFNGAFAAVLSENKSIEESITFAQAAAAISVTRMGAQPSIPYRKEIEKFIG